MSHPRPPVDPASGLLPEATAARLLERASELEAMRRNGVAVADLRAAAMEAGISAEAFDSALSEMRAAEVLPARPRVVPPRRRGRVARAAGGVALVLLGALVASRMIAPAADASPAASTEQSLVLRCVPADEAAAVLRPILADGQGTIVLDGSQSSRTITLRGTPESLRIAAEVLKAHEDASPSCARAPAAPR